MWYGASFQKIIFCFPAESFTIYGIGCPLTMGTPDIITGLSGMKNAQIEIEHVMKNIDIRKALLMLTLVLSGSSAAASYEVRSDLLGRKQIYFNDNLVVTAKEKQGGVFYYDAERTEIGHSRVLADGCTVYFDAGGTLQGTSCSDGRGHTEYRDASGAELEAGAEIPVMFYDEVIVSNGSPEHALRNGGFSGSPDGGRTLKLF